MNAKLRKLRKQIERAGGAVMIPDDLPDPLAEAFVKAILDCPDCARAIAAAKRTAERREH